MTVFTFDDLNQRYSDYTCSIRCECVFATELVGGQPADESGVRAYVKHHLEIADEKEAEKAVQRILHEEVQSVTPPEGELPEGKLYGLRVIRRGHLGAPYLGDWMIKANIKQATSRMFIFQQILGTKGAFAEAGRVTAWKYSRLNGEPNHVYLIGEDGQPAKTYFKEFMGRVMTPQGAVSIIHRSECVAPGTKFAYEFQFPPVKGLDEDALRDAWTMSMICGLGSARSLECGKFRIERMEMDMKKLYRAKKKDEGESAAA